MRYWWEEPGGKRQRFQLASTREDYVRLVGFLQARSGPVRIALEPTGNLHRTLAYRLLREGFPVVSVSSVAGARYREAMFNSWDKNDPKGNDLGHLDPLERSRGSSSTITTRSWRGITTSRNFRRRTSRSPSLASAWLIVC